MKKRSYIRRTAEEAERSVLLYLASIYTRAAKTGEVAGAVGYVTSTGAHFVIDRLAKRGEVEKPSARKYKLSPTAHPELLPGQEIDSDAIEKELEEKLLAHEPLMLEDPNDRLFRERIDAMIWAFIKASYDKEDYKSDYMVETLRRFSKWLEEANNGGLNG